MKFEHVCIESLVHFLPEEVLSSEAIEKKLAPVYERLKLPEGRLELMTGIKERRMWKPGTMPSEVASKAGQKALNAAGISSDDIGCLIHSSVCRDFLEPATASVVHENLGLSEHTLIFDISNACLGFLNGMTVVANMIENGLIKAGLVVAGENGRPLVDSTIKSLLSDSSLTRKSIKNSFASLTIGCGAAAAVLVHSSLSNAGHQLIGGAYLVASKFNDLCRGGAISGETGVGTNEGLLMNTDSEALLHAGCELARRTWEKTKGTLGICNKDIKRFFCHQVGAIHRKLLLQSLEIDNSLDYPTFPFLGNMGSVSLPVTLALGAENGMIDQSDTVALLGIGSGINSMMLGVKW